MRLGSIMARALYGAFFVAVVPWIMVLWARATDRLVPLHAVHSLPAGLALVVAGLLLLGAGARDLVVRGRGLPMNAFPPARLVRSGVFRWIRNPMYIGFGVASAGMSIAAGSASGLWLVTPAACLQAAALVYGFERPELVRRFGTDATRPPLCSLPRGEADDEPPTTSQRAAVFLWVLLPWLIAFYAVQALGRPPDAFRMALPVEQHWPVWQWTEVLYDSAYIFVPLTPLLITTRRALRRFAISGGVATAVVTLLWLTVPVVATNRPFEPENVFGRLLAFEQHSSAGVAAFPAFHVLWVLIAAEAWSAVGGPRHRRLWRRTGWGWAMLITVSCITTGMHTVIEMLSAAVLFVPLRDPQRTWLRIRAATERTANSWREWHLGPVRVINHALYAAAAAGVGLVIVATAVGPGHFGAVVWVSVCIIVGAGLWAQLLEGSSVLLRPFGWYGGVVGGLAGAFTAPLIFDAPVMPMLAAFAIAAPWIQILGRVRCLVQGCCHGGPAPGDVGIRYHHRRSRVSQLAGLAGRPIHATPLYSIAGNIVIGAVLLRLRALGAPDTLIVGVYLILGGAARFVEEGYRAEPQTPIVAGLHSYQWLAITSSALGISCTTLRATTASSGWAPIDWRVLGGALVMAAIAGCAMGVDFPRSNTRYSRLAAAD